jgi:hypothetical protein
LHAPVDDKGRRAPTLLQYDQMAITASQTGPVHQKDAACQQVVVDQGLHVCLPKVSQTIHIDGYINQIPAWNL